MFTSYRGTKYYLTSSGNKKFVRDEDLEQPEEQKVHLNHYHYFHQMHP